MGRGHLINFSLWGFYIKFLHIVVARRRCARKMLTIIFEIAPQTKIFLKNAYFSEIFNENLPLFTFLGENTFARRRRARNFGIFHEKEIFWLIFCWNLLEFGRKFSKNWEFWPSRSQYHDECIHLDRISIAADECGCSSRWMRWSQQMNAAISIAAVWWMRSVLLVYGFAIFCQLLALWGGGGRTFPPC